MAQSVGAGKGSSILIDDKDIDEFNVGFNEAVEAPTISGIKAGGSVTANLTVNQTDYDAIDRSYDVVDDVVSGAYGLAGQSVSAIAGESTQNRIFAGKAIDRIAESEADARATLARQADANRDALVGTFQGTLSSINSFAGRSFDFVDTAFDTLDDAYENSLASLSGAVGKVTDATTKQIGAFADATRSETAASFDKLVKYGAIAATILALAVIVTRKGA